MALVPATFMTAVIVSYILIAPEGFQLPQLVSYVVGVTTALLVMGGFFLYENRYANRQLRNTEELILKESKI